MFPTSFSNGRFIKLSLFLTLCLGFSSVTCWLISQSVATAHDKPTCFIVPSSGQVVNLNHPCESSGKRDPNLETVQEILKRGRKLGDSERYQEAIAEFTKAIDLSPNYHAYILRASARILVKDFQGAANDYEQAAQLAQDRGDFDRAEFTQNLANETRKSI